MPSHQREIALVLDFDDTITHDSTSAFLDARGVDVDAFWSDTVARRLRDGWDPAIAWLDAFIGLAADGGPLAGVTESDLAAFGVTIRLHPGVDTLLGDLKRLCDAHTASPTLRSYIVSGGLESIINASPGANLVDGVRGCRLRFDDDGRPIGIRNAIDFTSKTRCLFEINKGIFDRARDNPLLVNESMPHDRRPIPFENMIYIGDGLTDIPSFSLVRGRGGVAIGILDEEPQRSAREKWLNLASAGRTDLLLAPRYAPDQPLGAMLRAVVEAICNRMDQER
jgi:phosphoserine phosphatase